MKNLSEIQMIKFIGTEQKKGMTRVSFLAGMNIRPPLFLSSLSRLCCTQPS